MAERRDIKLTGLVGSNPLGALAAFGLLRVCSEIQELSQPRLYWSMEHDWIAVLNVPINNDANTLLSHLVTRQQSLKLSAFSWSEDIRVQPQDYRLRLVQETERATSHDRLGADYYAAFGSEMVTDGSKGLVKPTAFHMTSGQQKFLRSTREIAESLRDDSTEAFHEALFGPWKYEDQYHALGWDPITERLYALRHRAPTTEAPRSVRAAVWFAVESLPLFPTATASKKLATTGFARKHGVTSLVWPVWREAIGLDSMKTLLASSELLEPEGWEALGARGVAAIYEAVRSEFGQGYAILRPATLLWNLI
jgi:hypothetical protein